LAYRSIIVSTFLAEEACENFIVKGQRKGAAPLALPVGYLELVVPELESRLMYSTYTQQVVPFAFPPPGLTRLVHLNFLG